MNPVRPIPPAVAIAIAIALLLSCGLPSARAQEQAWIGLEVPPYPAGMESPIGACVGSGTAPEEVCAYSIGTLTDAKGEPKYIVAGRAAGHVGNEAHWIVTDVIAHPRLEEREYLSLASCERNGVPDAAVVAVVDTRGAEEMYESVRWARRVEQGRFVEIPATGIRCYNEGYGE